MVSKYLSLVEFSKRPEVMAWRKTIVGSSIFLYVWAGLQLFIIMVSGSMYPMLDLILLLGAGLAMHLTMSVWSAVIYLGYILISIGVAISGANVGWFVLVGLVDSIFALIGAIKIYTAWVTYKNKPAKTVKKSTKRKK